MAAATAAATGAAPIGVGGVMVADACGAARVRPAAIAAVALAARIAAVAAVALAAPGCGGRLSTTQVPSPMGARRGDTLAQRGTLP